MDKRYLLILVIIIICCVNLSIIVNNSDIVGSASASAGKYLFSLPDGFSLQESSGNSTVIQNNKGVRIYLESSIDKSDNYNRTLDYLENESDIEVLSEGTLNIENITVDTVYFQSNNTDRVAYYFEKDNTPFKIVMSNFNYDNNRNLTIEYVTDIIQSIRFDYKSA